MRRFLPLLLLFTAALPAQNPYGRITGRVTDSAGAIVPGAAIRLVQVGTNVPAASTTNNEGNYDLQNLNPGQYRVTVEMQGFKKYERGPIEVRVGDVIALDVSLEVGALTESITVVDEAALLESASSNVGQVIDNRRILDLPLPGGSPMYLMQLAPGIVSTNPPTHGWLPHAVDAVSNLASAGTRTRSSEFTLDGIPNMTQGGQVSFSPPPEMIQEFRVQTAAFDASIGHFSGAHVNMVMKSGANDVHGNLYFLHQSRPLMSRPFFINKSIYDTATGPVTQDKISRFWPPVKTHRYRATASGPVYLPKVYDGRNRTFWTYGLDVLDRTRPESRYSTVPTVEQRQGDFASLLRLGPQYQVYDPATIAPGAPGRFNRQPFPGNLVPASRIDPMAKKILGYFPAPNATGTADGRDNYYDPNISPIQYHSHSMRVDHSINANHRLYGTFTWANTLVTQNQSFHNEALGFTTGRYHRGLALDHVAALRPNLVLNLRYGMTRFLNPITSVSKGMDLAMLGFSTALTSQISREVASFPEITIGGLQALGYNIGSAATTNYHTVSGTVSHTRGNHSLRMGAEYRILQENSTDYNATTPRIDFDAAWTRGPVDNSPAAPIGQGMASFLLGLPTGGYVDKRPSYAEQSEFLGIFLQDDWKLTRRLTVNAGLRYELEFPTTERYNRTNRGFDFAAANPIEQRARAAYAQSPIPELPAANFRTPGGLMFAGVDGRPRSLWDIDRNNFSPRIGLAWSLSPRFVVRAGYGIFFEGVGADRVDVFQQGFTQRTNLVPSFDNGQTFRATLANPFPDGLLEPSGAAGGLTTFLGRAVGFATPERRAGYMQRWSLNVQREFPHRVLIEAGYIGNRGTGLGVSEQYDAVPAQYLSTLNVRDEARIGVLTANVPNPFARLPEFTGSNFTGNNVQRQQLLMPYPHLNGVTSTEGTGFSWYHSMQIRAEKRFSHGYTLQLAYTWSKLMEAIEKLNATDLHPHHVVSPQDRPHHLVVSGIYELPFGKGKKLLSAAPRWADFIAGGWSLQGIYQGQSGPPVGFGNIFFYGDVHDIVLPRAERTVERWFNTDAGFERDSRRQPAQNLRTFPLRFTGLRADGYNNWDLSVFKNFRIRERLTFQLRGEAQDAFNHAMFAAPNNAPANTLFGSVNGTVGAEQRRISVVGKLTW